MREISVETLPGWEPPKPVRPAAATIPEVVDEDAILREVVQLGWADVQVVVFTNTGRLDFFAPLATNFSQVDVRVRYPKNYFTAGIFAASADVFIFDLEAIGLGRVLELIPQCREHTPRAVVVAVLEQNMPPNSVPESTGVHLVFHPTNGLDGFAQAIERLLLG